MIRLRPSLDRRGRVVPPNVNAGSSTVYVTRRGTVGVVEPHPDIAPLAGLLGTWVGEGEGEYPTIEPFRYREEISFTHVGKPFLAYRQSTSSLATGLPAHAEAGYLRAVGHGQVELVLAHPTGLVEIEEGAIELAHDDRMLTGVHALKLHLRSTTVAGAPTAKEVRSLERRIEVAGEVLEYTLAMSAVGQAHQHHLRAVLHRQ